MRRNTRFTVRQSPRIADQPDAPVPPIAATCCGLAFSGTATRICARLISSCDRSAPCFLLGEGTGPHPARSHAHGRPLTLAAQRDLIPQVVAEGAARGLRGSWWARPQLVRRSSGSGAQCSARPDRPTHRDTGFARQLQFAPRSLISRSSTWRVSSGTRWQCTTLLRQLLHHQCQALRDFAVGDGFRN